MARPLYALPGQLWPWVRRVSLLRRHFLGEHNTAYALHHEHRRSLREVTLDNLGASKRREW